MPNHDNDYCYMTGHSDKWGMSPLEGTACVRCGHIIGGTCC